MAKVRNLPSSAMRKSDSTVGATSSTASMIAGAIHEPMRSCTRTGAEALRTTVMMDDMVVMAGYRPLARIRPAGRHCRNRITMANTRTLPTTAVVPNSSIVFSIPMISAARMVPGT